MASGQEMPGVMGKMGVSESVQKTRSTPTPMRIARTQRHKKQECERARTHTHAHTLSIYSVGTSASLRGSEGLPAHL